MDPSLFSWKIESREVISVAATPRRAIIDMNFPLGDGNRGSIRDESICRKARYPIWKWPVNANSLCAIRYTRVYTCMCIHACLRSQTMETAEGNEYYRSWISIFFLFLGNNGSISLKKVDIQFFIIVFSS